MGGVKQLFDFIIFKQISGKGFLYAHTQQIYHTNSAFHSVIGGNLKCNNFDLRILKCNLSDCELNLNELLDCFKVLVCFHRLKSHFEVHRLALVDLEETDKNKS